MGKSSSCTWLNVNSRVWASANQKTRKTITLREQQAWNRYMRSLRSGFLLTALLWRPQELFIELARWSVVPTKTDGETPVSFRMEFLSIIFILILLAFFVFFLLVGFSDGDLTLMLAEKLGTRLSTC